MDEPWGSEFDPKPGIALRERLDRATRVACEFASHLGSPDIKLSREAWEWITEYKADIYKEGR